MCKYGCVFLNVYLFVCMCECLGVRVCIRVYRLSCPVNMIVLCIISNIQ